MMEADFSDILRALAASPPAAALRASRYAYPLVNALHIIGLASLFGAILALDLRLLGFGRAVPLAPLAAFLPKVAGGGLLLAVLTGIALFTVQPVGYVANPAFLLKLALVLAGATHAALVHRGAAWQRMRRGSREAAWPLRLSAAASLLLWIAAIVAGRFIGFE